MVTRCFWPPDSDIPRSPTTVWIPRGIEARSLSSPATRTASMISSRPASIRPKAALYAMVWEKRFASWGTTPITRRSSLMGISRISRPSSSTRPAVGSSRRVNSLTIVVLPAPVRPTIASLEPAGTFTLISRNA